MIEACRKNIRQAQFELYQRFSYMTKGICLRYAANEVEAEDVMQEAFIRIFNNLNSYSASGPLGAWIRKITVNMALEQYRKNKALKNLTLVYDIKENTPTSADDAIEKMKLDDLLKLIQKLPVGFRTVFNLYAVEGYNHAEIGELLSISEGTSKSQYSRARVLLRQMIDSEFLEDKKKAINYED